MSRAMHRRLDRMANDARVTAWRIFDDEGTGDDAYVCDEYPGRVFTEADIDALDLPDSVGIIVLTSVDQVPS